MLPRIHLPLKMNISGVLFGLSSKLLNLCMNVLRRVARSTKSLGLKLLDLRSDPGARNALNDQSHRIPVRAQVPVPGGDGACSTQQHSDPRTHHGVPHGSIRCQAGSDVAAENSIDRPINGCPREQAIGHPLPKRREDTQLMENCICSDRKDYHRKKSRDDRPNAPPHLAWSHGFYNGRGWRIRHLFLLLKRRRLDGILQKWLVLVLNPAPGCGF